MIVLDSRVGSVHYAPLLGSRCIVDRLESADAAFSGSGGITIGVEIKKIGDAIGCMFSGRLADGQIPAMRAAYDVAYLVVEGIYGPGPDGVLMQYKGELGRWGQWRDALSGQKRYMYAQFEKWLSTLTLHGGLILRQTPTAECTAALLVALEDWWLSDDHRSYHTMFQYEDAAALSRPTMLRRIAAELPLIGWQRSSLVAKKFGSVERMVAASEAEWMTIPGIGEGIAKKVVEALHNES